MNKLIFAGVFLAVMCYLAQVEANPPTVYDNVYELTVEQVKSILKFIVEKLFSISQSINALKTGAIAFKESIPKKQFN